MSDPVELARKILEFTGTPTSGRLSFDWIQIEQDLGLRLPPDYKLLAETAPSGWFRRFIRPGKPVTWPDGRQRLLSKSDMEGLVGVRERISSGKRKFPYSIYPESDGLLPWGRLRGQGYAFWLTGNGDPAEWPIVVSSNSLDYWARFEGVACEFIIEVAAARYDASGFTEGPIRVTADEAGNSMVDKQPIILADRPVFEPDTKPSPSPRPVVPPRTYWEDKLRSLGEWRPVNEMPALREMIGEPSWRRPRVDWEAIKSQLGFGLPADYRDFIDTYGPGKFGNIIISAPGMPGDADMFALMLRKYRQIRSVVQIGNSPPFFPEPGGTICWGEVEGGWVCGWAPVGDDPDGWTVTGILANPQLRNISVQPGVSFSSMLKEHARPQLGSAELVPSWKPADGPVVFTPYEV